MIRIIMNDVVSLTSAISEIKSALNSFDLCARTLSIPLIS